VSACRLRLIGMMQLLVHIVTQCVNYSGMRCFPSLCTIYDSLTLLASMRSGRTSIFLLCEIFGMSHACTVAAEVLWLESIRDCIIKGMNVSHKPFTRAIRLCIYHICSRNSILHIPSNTECGIKHRDGIGVYSDMESVSLIGVQVRILRRYCQSERLRGDQYFRAG